MCDNRVGEGRLAILLHQFDRRLSNFACFTDDEKSVNLSRTPTEVYLEPPAAKNRFSGDSIANLSNNTWYFAREQHPSDSKTATELSMPVRMASDCVNKSTVRSYKNLWNESSNSSRAVSHVITTPDQISLRSHGFAISTIPFRASRYALLKSDTKATGLIIKPAATLHAVAGLNSSTPTPA